MKVEMPVEVVSEACRTCTRLKVMVLDEHAAGGEIVSRDMECAHYDDCLNALDIWTRGQKEQESGKK